MSKEQTALERIKDRFESYIYYGLDGCWYWTGAVCYNGYGRFLFRNRIPTVATRVAYELYHGVEPGKLYVLHKCDNPSCVNPHHLFLGTQSDNMLDMNRKGRKKYHAQDNPRTKLTNEDVLFMRSGKHSIKELMGMFKMSYSAIWRIVTNRVWTSI